ncbi:rev protein [Caprine arthritis encephalitis virus Roccaverano]|nr:rev protein [Caprine arthritis encephalitis virus Roccaverano]
MDRRLRKQWMEGVQAYKEFQADEESGVSDHRSGLKGEGYRLRGRRRRRRGWYRWLRKLRARRFTEPDPDLEDPIPDVEALTLDDRGEGADAADLATRGAGAVVADVWMEWRSPQKEKEKGGL